MIEEEKIFEDNDEQTKERLILNSAKRDIFICLAYLTCQDEAVVRAKYEKYHIDCASGALIVAAKALNMKVMELEWVLRSLQKQINEYYGKRR